MKKHIPVPLIMNSPAEDRAEKQWPIGHVEDPVHPENPEHEAEDKGRHENAASEKPEKKAMNGLPYPGPDQSFPFHLAQLP